MTKNQIEYQKLLTQREYNKRTLELEESKLQEQKRSNLRNEELTSIRDTGTLSLRSAELGESTRHNKTVEVETVRSHKADETERNRHNIASERVEASKAAAQHAQVQLGYANLAEQSTHNRAMEGLTARQLGQRDVELAQAGSKIALESNKLAEAKRHNVTLESIQQFEADLKRQQVDINKWRARFQNASDVVGMLDTIIDDLDQFQRTNLLKHYEQVFNLDTGEMAIVKRLFRQKGVR